MRVDVSGLVRTLRAVGAVAVGALMMVLGGPSRSAVAAPSESISTYDVRVAVGADGRLAVDETITYDFGGNSRHGIVRRIPVRAPYDAVRDRLYPLDRVTVTMDGSPIPVARDDGGRDEVLTIGDPNRTITGSHVYRISYTVRGVINHFRDHDELYWNAVGGEWSVPIAAATATVAGPAAVGRGGCFTGPAGSRLPCTTATTDPTSAAFHQSVVGKGSGMTVVVAFPAGSVRRPGPILAIRGLPAAFELTTGTVSVTIGLALIGMVLVVVAAGWIGRDRRVSRANGPAVLGEFAPPEGIRPGQVGALIDGGADVLAVTATIVDCAVRGHLRIEEIPTSRWRRRGDWELTRLTGGDPWFLPYERTLFQALFATGERVRLSQLRNTFAATQATVRRHLEDDLVGRGWYSHRPTRSRGLVRAMAVGLLLASVAGTLVLAFTTTVAVVGVGLVPAALVLFAMAGRFVSRTASGSAMLARVRGFRRYIAGTGAERVRSDRWERTFSEYLPYAMVFGLADRWTGAFTGVDAGAHDMAGLYWYAGSPDWDTRTLAVTINRLATTTSAAITSTPSAAGYSGFSGDSGSSGGGGGGGGGGSW